MRIDTIHIDGFGQFHSEPLNPAPGLTVVRGPNEAGKTTLLAFTRAMLFGFETHRYPALRGGKRGGWLDIVMADGRELRIERYGDRGGEGKLRVIEADKDLGPGQLAFLLQGVESTVYQNIFAFGLGELTQFETLTGDQVAARIYGAGLGTGGVSGLKVEQSLHDRMEGWFKSGGSKPKINALLKRLEDIDGDLDDRDLPRAYAEAGRKLDKVIDQLAELSNRYDALESSHRRQQRLVDGWETWLELRHAQEAREPLGEVRTFEETTLERLSALEASLTESEKVVEVAVRERDRAQDGLDGAVVDSEALARRGELEALVEATKIEAARADERARTERELAGATAAVDGALSNLGDGWSVERVESFDDSIAIKSEISGRFRTLLSASEQAATSARRNHEAATDQLGDANGRAEAAAARVTELQEALAGRPASAVRERGLREIQSLSDQLAIQRRIAADTPDGDLEKRRATLDERRSHARELSSALASRESAAEMLPSAIEMAESASGQEQRQYLLPIAIGIGGVVVAIILVLLEVSIAVAGIVAAAGVGGAVAWGVVLRKQGPTRSAGTRERLEQQLADATETVDRLGPELGLGSSPGSTDIARLEDSLAEERRKLDRDDDRLAQAQAGAREVERLEEELATAATQAGASREPSTADLEALGQAIAKDRETEAQRAAALERETQLKAAAATQSKRTEELAVASEKRAQEAVAAQAEWADWLGGHDLDRAYDRETAMRVVDSVTSAKGIVAALRKAESRSKELAQEQDAYVGQVDALASLLPDGEAEPDDVAATATLLTKRLADARTGERERNDLAHALEGKQTTLVSAEDSRDAAQSELDTFLAEASIEDASNLRSVVDRSRQAADLDVAIAGAHTTLTTLSGPGKALEELTYDLDAVEDIADVKAAVSEISGQLIDLARERDGLNQEAGGLRTSRSEMESDAAATELRQEREDLLSQLRAAAERWAVVALAHQILNRSRSVYEEAHRPAVIEKAEYFFKGWTAGRYERIVAPLGEDIRGVVRRDGVEVDIPGLSRGTSEQLYLALRFGLVQHFVETSGEPLPIVMDDILVNFDEDRAARAARSIEELSKTCQVIYFTCHPTTPLEADVERELKPISVD